MDIALFDGRLGKEVVLVARWRILDGHEKKLFGMNRSHIREETGSGGYEDLVTAQSWALARISKEIVEMIYGLVAE